MEHRTIALLTAMAPCLAIAQHNAPRTLFDADSTRTVTFWAAPGAAYLPALLRRQPR